MAQSAEQGDLAAESILTQGKHIITLTHIIISIKIQHQALAEKKER